MTWLELKPVKVPISFAGLIVACLFCASCSDALAFGKMGGPYPEDPYRWLHAHIGWLGCFTIFAILMKHAFYQGMFENQMYASWLGVHILIVGVGAWTSNFLLINFYDLRETDVIWGIGLIGIFTFLAAYGFERWAFKREKNGNLTRSMSYTLIGVNVLYALLIAFLVAAISGPVYDA